MKKWCASQQQFIMALMEHYSDKEGGQSSAERIILMGLRSWAAMIARGRGNRSNGSPILCPCWCTRLVWVPSGGRGRWGVYEKNRRWSVAVPERGGMCIGFMCAREVEFVMNGSINGLMTTTGDPYERY